MEIEKEMIRLYKLGVQIDNIAILTGETKGKVISVIYRKHDLAQRRIPFNREEVGEVRRLFLDKKMTKLKIAEVMGIKHGRVQSILSAYRILKHSKAK